MTPTATATVTATPTPTNTVTATATFMSSNTPTHTPENTTTATSTSTFTPTHTVNTSPIFEDVPYSYWANLSIERLYNAGITGGCSITPLNYCPETTVTRAQMAVFLERGMHGSSFVPPNVVPTFNDTAGNFA